MAGQALRQALGRVTVGYLANDQAVEADDRGVMQTKIGLRGIGLLIGEGVADQEAVELLAAAGEAVNRVITSQLFNPKALCHPGSGASKADGSRNRRSIR